MDTIETLIPDNKGNHLVVVLYFYDEIDKRHTFLIPEEYQNLEIADINIRKLDLEKPLGVKSLFKLCDWLIDQFMMFPNAIFSFICSMEDLVLRHSAITPEEYRWKLFEALYHRSLKRLQSLDINSISIIVGPEGYQADARIFYRPRHSSIVHIVESHLKNKYR